LAKAAKQVNPMIINNLSIGFKSGEFSAVKDITIPLDGIGPGRSYAVYEFCRVHKGRVFYGERHLDRLFHSLLLMNLNIGYSREKIEGIIEETIAKNKARDFFLKIFAFPEKDIKKDTLAPLYILPVYIPPFPDEIYQKGATLILKEYQRFLPEAKSTNYIASVFWQHEMDKTGAIDVLFKHRNKILECSRGNIFIVKDETFITPGQHILNGITRSIVLDIIKNEGLPFQVRQIKTSELPGADEIFISSTTKLVMPVVRINKLSVNDGKPGPLSLKILDKYKDILA
jgi:branched-subunit amino acid aminotransferase/4-amino-4-deoxychorismate lyase